MFGLLAGCAERVTHATTQVDAAQARSESPQKRDGVPDTSAAAPQGADTAANAGSDTSGLAADPRAGDRADTAAPDTEGAAPGPLGPPPTVIASEGRVVAIGDVHGDLEAARRALRLGGLVDQNDHWVGAHTVAVQVGDQLDRGDGERAILDWFEVLAQEAHAAGGAFIALIGNHEQMNAQLDFRYVTPGGWADFADVPTPAPIDPRVAELPLAQRGRAAAFLPGGPYALRLATHNVIQVVDTTLFVHGGVLPIHAAAGLDALNQEHRAWLRGEGELSELWQSGESPVWDRSYSSDTTAAACVVLADMLDQLGLERMVVAHTVQDNGINSACDGRVFRVDVGLAAYYGGPMEVLEILGGVPKVLH